MQKLYWFECCEQFDSGGYCPYCNRQRQLIFDDTQLLKILEPDSHLRSIVEKFGMLESLIYRYVAQALIPHIQVILSHLRKLNFAQLLPKIIVAEQKIIEWDQRIRKSGNPVVVISQGEYQQLKSVVEEADIWINESYADRIFYGAIKIGILNLINNSIPKIEPTPNNQ